MTCDMFFDDSSFFGVFLQNLKEFLKSKKGKNQKNKIKKTQRNVAAKYADTIHARDKFAKDYSYPKKI